MYLNIEIKINGNSKGKALVPNLVAVSLLIDHKIKTEKNEAKQNANRLSIRSLL
tara:strand:+ start:1624 stop:1785 length:162 start_codon:yes stop_codon:yes gene_type:complete